MALNHLMPICKKRRNYLTEAENDMSPIDFNFLILLKLLLSRIHFESIGNGLRLPCNKTETSKKTRGVNQSRAECGIER